MAKNVTTLTVETLQSLDGTENVVMFDSAEGKRSTLSTLSDYAVRKHKTTGMTQTIYEQGETLKQEITELKASVGTPLVANTASAMTDQTKIYVYTGSETGYSQGHWYYWNGSAWTDGGVYQATAVETDKTLTLSDKPADSKTVGDALATKATPAQVDTKISENIDSTLSVSGQSADAKVTGDSLKAKAESEGAVSMAKALVGGKYTIDQSPYHYRQSPDAGALDEKVVGGTLAWNQQCDPSKYSNAGTFYGITITKNSDGTVGISGTATGNIYFYFFGAGSASIGIEEGHKCLIYGCPSGGSSTTYSIQINNNGWKYDYGNGLIISAISSASGFGITVRNGAAISGTIVFKPMLIDLTTLFGSTIADYIYSLEQSSAGAGVDWVRQYIDLDTYHEYCEPTLKSVEGLQSRDVVGFNQWDEEWEVGGVSGSNGNLIPYTERIRSKNFIRILPNTTYCVSVGASSVMIVDAYDENETFISALFNGRTVSASGELLTTPSNAKYLRFSLSVAYGTAYKHDVCINLSDPSKNGTYEPYEKHSYPLDSSLELRGIPKLSDGKMYFDGDEYSSDGQVTRRYGLEQITYQYLSNLSSTYLYYDSARNAVWLRNWNYQKIAPRKAGGVGGLCNAYAISIHNSDIYSSQYRIYFFDTTSVEEFLSKVQTLEANGSGLYILYELATPTTETAQPYQSPQLVGSTEEYVTTGVVPVGHESRYYEDITGKVNDLPSDFSTLIAPVEKSFTATRNYTVGSFVIVNNQLYKVTSAISSGGTITPNSNCTATTIMAEILALA